MNSLANHEFDRICTDYYASWYRFHPQAAVEIGVYDYAGLLPPYDEDSHRALVVLHEELITALDELTVSGLDPDHFLDYQTLQGAAYLERKQLLTKDWRFLRPQDYLPVQALYLLQIRPVTAAADQLLLLLQSIPGYLAGARQLLVLRVEEIPKLWADSALIEARTGADFIIGLEHEQQWQSIPDLEYELQTAATAVRDFASFIEREICPRATGPFACGREYFEDLLHFRHGLPISVEGLYTFGQRLFRQTREALQQVEKELTAAGEPEQNLEALFSNHPDADQLIAAYQQAMDQAKNWLQEYSLISLPEPEQLRVIETPLFLRHLIPFAAYQEPAPDDPVQQGYYYVTPVSESGQLAEHNRLAIRHTSVHEAYPGHHTQFVTANKQPVSRSPVRLLNASATFYEGWAVYCEMLMTEQGFLEQPLSRYVLLRDRLWRVLRILLDIDLHVNGLSVEEAEKRMVDELGFPLAQARGEIAWYTEAPTIPMSYATGWAMISRLRSHLQQTTNFDLAEFHDRLLCCGSIALLPVIKRVFGNQAADEVINGLFAESTTNQC